MPQLGPLNPHILLLVGLLLDKLLSQRLNLMLLLLLSLLLFLSGSIAGFGRLAMALDIVTGLAG